MEYFIGNEEKYEDNVHDRLAYLMKRLGLNKNSFSVKIGVASSVIHNITGGRLGKRNKPSADLMAKICESFPQVNLNWLIMGWGEMWNPEGGNIKNAVQLNELADNELLGRNLENTYQKNFSGRNNQTAVVATVKETEIIEKHNQLQLKFEKLEEKYERLQERYEQLQDKYVALLENNKNH